MTARRWIHMLCVVALMGAVASPARAQGAARRQAAAHYRQGKAFYDAGAYAEAIAEYRAAYALAPSPGLLFNLGLAFRKQGDLPAALDHFRRYLAAEPEGKVADEAREFVAAITAELNQREQEQLAQQERERQERERQERERQERDRLAREQAARDRDEAERARRDTAAAPEIAPAPAAALAASVPPAHDRGRGLRIAGLVTVGAGVIALAAGVKFGLDARAHHDALAGHEEGPWTVELLDRVDAGERAERNMAMFTTAGAAAAVTGAVLYLVGRARRDEPPSIGVAPTTGGAAIGWSHRF